MVYETFMETIKHSLKERLGPEFTLTLQPITKNNGLILHGLCIGKADERAAPTIYLNHFYESYQKGRPFHAILDDIMALYQNSPLPGELPIEEFLSQEQIMEKIIFRLINEPAQPGTVKRSPPYFLSGTGSFYYILPFPSKRRRQSSYRSHPQPPSKSLEPINGRIVFSSQV